MIAVVFSKDRALQLHACLTSFARHATDADRLRMIILYAASSPRLFRQYQDSRAHLPGAVPVAPPSSGKVMHREFPLGEGEASQATPVRVAVYRRVNRPTASVID